MKIVESKEVYRSKVFWVTEDKAIDTKTGWKLERAVVRHVGSAAMLAADDRNRVLLVRQYRLPADAFLWEIPAGRIDEGETALQAAKRELVEETGLRAKKWTRIAQFWSSPGFLAERMTVFLATDLTAGESSPMEDERIETRWFARRELQEMIRDGKIQDAKTLVAFHAWIHR